MKLNEERQQRQIDRARENYAREIEPFVKIELKIFYSNTHMIICNNEIERKYSPEMEEILQKISKIKKMIFNKYFDQIIRENINETLG